MGTPVSKSSYKRPFCKPCHQSDNIEIEAHYLCEICSHHLCDKCFEYHRKTLLTQNHRTVKLGELENSETDFRVSGRRLSKTPEVSDKDIGSDESKRTKNLPLMENKPRNAYQKVTFTRGLNVSLESDKVACEIRGIAVLRDKIIVSDKANLKLKVFNIEYKFLLEHQCNKTPYDIDKLDDESFVVAFLDSPLTLYTVGDGYVRVLKEFETFLNMPGCISVSCYDGYIYSVTHYTLGPQDVSEIYVFRRGGRLKIRLQQLSDGRKDFNYLQRITVNPKTGNLYVTDWEKGIVVLSSKGEILTDISLRNLKNPQGIATDDDGQIYVCGSTSHNLLKLSAAGTEPVEMLASNPRTYLAECVKVYGNKLFLARKQSSVISIYELS